MSASPLNLLASWRPDNVDYNVVPRTPHSRSGRAEEGFTENDFHDEDAPSFANYRQQQTEPLLASSTSTTFPVTGYRSRGDDNDARRTESSRASPWSKSLTGRAVLSNTPLILGLVVAGLLLSLVVVSFTRPDALNNAIGYTAQTSAITPTEDLELITPLAPQPSIVDTIPPVGHEISYENYSTFPLTGKQYRHECSSLLSKMKHSHGAYWAVPQHGVMDVIHHDDMTDYHLPEGMPTKVCSKTITYQLDGEVGLVADLALMAQAAAFAREVRTIGVINMRDVVINSFLSSLFIA
jgi:hypothetical protein